VREHGAAPLSNQALVGTYLERLPANGSPDASDDLVPVVE
jgi:hypothetical protein